MSVRCGPLGGRGLPWAPVLALLLVACGGGGGGSPGGSDPVADPSTQPLALNAQNFEPAALLVVEYMELAQLIGQRAFAEGMRGMSPGAATSFAQTCPNGGQLSTTLVDRDANGRLSAGDAILLDHARCGVAAWGAVLDGRITVEFAAVDTIAGPRVAGRVTVGAPFSSTPLAPGRGRLELSGTLAFEGSGSDLRTLVTTSATGSDGLRIARSRNGGTAVDLLRDIATLRASQFDEGTIVNTVDFRLDSQSLGGRLLVSSRVPWTSRVGSYPEAGELRLSGRGPERLQIGANRFPPVEQFAVSFDGDANGVAEAGFSRAWLGANTRFLWSDDHVEPVYREEPYAILPTPPGTLQGRLANDFAVGVNETFWLQFSRRLVAVPDLRGRFVDRGPEPLSSDRTRVDVPATVSLQGAVLVLRPSTQLRHARRYALELSNDGGITWGGQETFFDGQGGSVVVNLGLGDFITPDTLRARIAGTALLNSPATSVSLDGTASVSPVRPVATWRWRQLSGPPLVLETPDSPTTRARWSGAAPAQLGYARIELTLTDTAGESDSTEFEISVLDGAATPAAVYLRSTERDFVGEGIQRAYTADTGSLVLRSNAPSEIAVSYANSQENFLIALRGPLGGPLQTGSYPDAASPALPGGYELSVSGWARGCSATGRFEILEIERDAGGAITRLALDFEQRCSLPDATPLFGSVRFNSRLPLTP